MDIVIPDSWLKDFLKTKATPVKIAEYLSLCGPSVERVEKRGGENLYHVEVTTNRVDTASVFGLAREASAILPRFGVKAKLAPFELGHIENEEPLGIEIKNNQSLCRRILAVKIDGSNLKTSPSWLKTRLGLVGARALNTAVDITNYCLWEVGHPVHVFDYDRLKTKTIVIREADKGEELSTFDGKRYKLTGGEVVFDNGEGEIIDLPGIMGTKNSVVTPETKNILLWIESVDPVRIRRTSMNLNIRSQAAVLNEKGVDPELGLTAILRAVWLFEKMGGKITSSLVDINPSPFRGKQIKLTGEFINQCLGMEIEPREIKEYLEPLGFEVAAEKFFLVKVPSFRANDISIPEDIVEEVARIYGYHRLPSKLMPGVMPEPLADSPFAFEQGLKLALKSFGGNEVYTSSLVGKDEVHPNALRLKNPLGEDGEYLRTSLRPSLVRAAKENTREDGFHLFEIASVYLPKRDDLPEERLMLAGIFSGADYRQAKGVVEALLEELGIVPFFKAEEAQGFLPSKRVVISANKQALGEFGVLEKAGFLYYELAVHGLRREASLTPAYKPLPKYPAQIEDLTLRLPAKTRLGEVLSLIEKADPAVKKVELTDIFEAAHTFRIWYQSPKKTLTNEEVRRIREGLVAKLKKGYAVGVK